MVLQPSYILRSLSWHGWALCKTIPLFITSVKWKQRNRGLEVDNVRRLFRSKRSVARRENRNGINLKSVHVDNCCQSRKQIQEVMGDVPVKLNLFHAVQRVTNVIPKRNEFSKTFCKEFSLVFGQDGDLGDDRKTPEPPMIRKNLDTFCERWSSLAR